MNDITHIICVNHERTFQALPKYKGQKLYVSTHTNQKRYCKSKSSFVELML